MKHKIKPGDHVVARLDYDGWTGWFFRKYVRTRKPIRVVSVGTESSIEIYLPYGVDGKPMTFWTSTTNKYERCGRSCPMEVQKC